MAGNDPAAAMTAEELLQKYTELQDAIAADESNLNQVWSVT